MILHLVAKTEWDSKQANPSFLPDAFAKDGFMHCTKGDDLMLQVANRFYTGVPGEFLVLDIDENKVTSPIKWEPASSPATPITPPSTDSVHAEAMPPEAIAEYGVPAKADTPTTPVAPSGPLFPHIYGPLNRDAIVDIRRVVRASDGAFMRFVQLEPAPAGMNLKKPSELAHELVDATGEFSDALARYKDHLEAHMDELDKNIKDKLG